jgi:hypothetical protein
MLICRGIPCEQARTLFQIKQSNRCREQIFRWKLRKKYKEERLAFFMRIGGL